MNTVSVWKRSLAIFLAALMIVGMIPLSEMLASDTYAATPSKLYLKPNSNWTKDGARFAAYFFGNGTIWVSMTDSDGDGVYEVTVPSGYPNVIFCRMNPDYSTNSWDANGIDYMWNQTGDLTIPTDGKNYFTVPADAWDGSTTTWSTYTPAGSTTEATYIVAGTANLCGNAWSPSDTNNKMTKQSDGIYTITYSNRAAGDYGFKVTDGTWDNAWPSSNKTFSLDSESHVTITFDPTSKNVTVDIEKVQTTTTYNVTFNGTNVSSDGEDSATSGTDYTATLTADDGYTLPSEITVKRGNTSLTSGTDYTYNSSTGALTINASAVTGDITITATGVAEEKAYYVFGTAALCGTEWTVTDANKMTMNSDGTYSITYNNVAGASNGTYQMKVTDNMGSYWGGDNNSNYWINVSSTSNVTITFNPSTGAINYTVTPTGTTGSTDDCFFVDTDIVDYLNDYRVNAGAVNGYSDDNQGIWQGSDNPVYTYLNYIIAQQDGYTYPLYFGDLLMVSNRYGIPYNEFTVGDYPAYQKYRQAGKSDLSNWNTGANVALYHDGGYKAVVQGLVHNELDQYGQLLDVDGKTQLFYFDKTSIESWTTSATGGKRLAAYYENLQFPFNMSYDEDTRVTTYSYDSATDNAVFIDYENYSDENENNYMYTDSNYAKDKNDNKGFFPLNKPGDYGNTSNYGFGVKFTIDFTVADDGTILAADGTETPVQFSFTGDDDVWVFIDGYLVLDMGGAHSKARGTIDFKNLNAIVEQAAQVSTVYKNPSYYNNTYGYDNDGEQRESLTVTVDKASPFPAALAEKFNTEYTTGISQVHTLTMFYMERGMNESNMSIEFSMSPIPTGLTVSKDIENVNPGLNAAVQDDDEFSFTVDATLNNEKVGFDGYELTDHGNITTDMTATNNKVTGVRGDKYAHSFTSGNLDAFTAGTSFVITEGSYDTNKYSGTRWVVYKYGESGYKIFESGTGTSAEFEMEDDATATYAVNFINSMKSGTLTVSKSYMDTLIDSGNLEFTFEVQLDLDGEGYKLYPGLTYDLYNDDTLVTEDVVSEDGTINLKAGQVAKINDIPVGTKYQVVEADNSDRWELSSSSGTEETMTVAGATASFVNMTTTNPLAGSVIYVEAGTNTEYNIADVTLSGVNSDTAGLVKIENGKLIVNAPEAGKDYTFTYVGVHSDGRYVSGFVTVYSYKAMDKTYVFDFGLSSVISNTTTGGHGLFQGGTFIIVDDNATSTLTITGGGTQTTITASGSFDESDPSKVPTVTFTPVAFMSQVEEYTYTVTITANGKTFKANDPETGCTVTGTIKVMPANTVYYEDNFNVEDADNEPTQEIIFNKGNSSVALDAPSSNPTLSQSNDQSTNYGKDDCYKYSSSYDAYGESNGASTTLAHLQYAYFTFSGTGFDLISETKADSAGMAVYVFAGGFDQAHLDYVTNHSNTSQTPADLVFVNNYYANGSLYQVPVASVRLSTQSTYTVYVQALSTMYGDSVTIDGVRIYNPLTNTDGYKSNEKGVQIDELRVLYKNEYVKHAHNNNGTANLGLGKGSIIEKITGGNYETASALIDVYKSGPNNEIYLPANCGIGFSYKVDSSNWTLQIGAKAVTATDASKTFTVWVYDSSAKEYVSVGTVDLLSTTDMYYDLTTMLKDYNEVGQIYKIIITSDCSSDVNNEFVSLTTVKHSGVTLINENS